MQAAAAQTRPNKPTQDQAPASSAPARMDRQFIAENQIVERYLTGRLPPKGVMDFEQYCRRHPELLDELKLGDHLNSALRLLEAGGHAMPWEEKPRRWWQTPQALLATGSLCVVLALSTMITGGKLAAQSHRVSTLQQQLSNQPLDPVESTRSILLIPSRSPDSGSVVTIGGAHAELAEFKIDMTWAKYGAFQVSIDRVDQGRVAVLHNLVRDSNGDLRIALNSSALGPGDYRLSIDGLIWSGAAVPVAWVTFAIAH
jgi:hypothetical protein